MSLIILMPELSKWINTIFERRTTDISRETSIIWRPSICHVTKRTWETRDLWYAIFVEPFNVDFLNYGDVRKVDKLKLPLTSWRSDQRDVETSLNFSIFDLNLIFVQNSSKPITNLNHPFRSNMKAINQNINVCYIKKQLSKNQSFVTQEMILKLKKRREKKLRNIKIL